MRKILWNKKAKADYFENIDYLLANWSEKEAQNFIDEVANVEYILGKGNVDFQNTDIKGVKRLVVRKQITLFYRVRDKEYIEFLRFWNNNRNIKRFTL